MDKLSKYREIVKKTILKYAQFRPSPRHLIPASAPQGAPLGDNPLGEHDGFYYALLEKLPTAL